ncbi:hypothetical protein AAFX91_30205 [Bradyrhizobium sp. 31Argb]|uniref:hypothetical protein n=1 Tax=Bradyrhizobium sp. 31Argb TaxID=3141247 RepID=UPI00041F370F
MTKRQQKLERLASAILADDATRGIARPRSANGVAVSNRSLARRLLRENRQKIVSQYRTLPDVARRELTSRFKRERERNPKLDWTDWLSQNLRLTDAALPSLKSP